ncbi:hypothetical protein SFC88_06305 [Nocardioides sp. HM23]|uniref:hypothetical protein n=1 Tax=Nocardioides bizhenqiangii TaxID=3095076 RepID=UPI002ACAA305|nr:hypothetical protein [Nocardioides sp. HM23]MDZ5620425.1 hypothetical protein [Nocardioides sp. HM23]
MDDTTSPPQVATSSADDTAREFRASLEQRREAIDAAARSLEARQRSTPYADDIVRHAEALADRIESEARERAEQIVADAQARADRTIADAEAARAALLDVIERTRAELTAPGSAPAPSAGVDVLFGAVEAARPVSPPSSATPSSPPRRPAWPGFDAP